MSFDLPPPGKPPMRIYACPECGVRFSGPGVFRGGSNGKLCPNGHWHSMTAIYRHEKRQGAKARRPASVTRKLDSMGLGERTEQLAVALEWMLGALGRARDVLPDGSQARRLMDGAFGAVPDLARQILDNGRVSS